MGCGSDNPSRPHELGAKEDLRRGDRRSWSTGRERWGAPWASGRGDRFASVREKRTPRGAGGGQGGNLRGGTPRGRPAQIVGTRECREVLSGLVVLIHGVCRR